MALQIQGAGGSIAEVGAFSSVPVHTVNKPEPYGALGHYDFCGMTGAIAAGLAANGELLQLRWIDATRLCLIKKVKVTGMRATTAFAVGAIDIKVTKATSWSADGSGGGAVAVGGQENRLRTSMGLSLLSTGFRLATTAALGAGTKTLNTNDFGCIATHSSAGVGAATPIVGSIYLPTYDLFEQDQADGEHPIVLAQNEGIVVRATVPATGVWNLGIAVKWVEVAAF
jgi:hypothetical protein